VKDLLSARAKPGIDVLEIRGRGRHRAQGCRAEGSAPRRDERNGGKPACDLESPAGDVLVWDSITREVQGRPEQERPTSRAQNGAGGGAGRDVQRDDHRLPNEALVVDYTVPDVANHDAVLIAAHTAGDALLVHDVLADASAMDDFTVELRARVEDTFEASAEFFMTVCDDGAARVFDDTVV
jgi:hypothetical protein